MKHEELLKCEAEFERFCKRYEGLLPDKRQQKKFRVYVGGLLGQLERKSIEPIAVEQEVAVRSLQHFIGGSYWDDKILLQEHRRHVSETLGEEQAVIIIDPTTFPKRGDKSVGVQRQWCGQLGKEENCQASVNLAYASAKGHTFLDRRLYIPKSWASNQERRREAKIPEKVVFRNSWQLAYEMITQARIDKIKHSWITADEEFGKAPMFHDLLDQAGERYIIEVPIRARVWVRLPKGSIRGRKGLSDRLGQIGSGRLSLKRVDEIAKVLLPKAWKIVSIRDASKGPIAVKAVALRVKFHRGSKKTRPEGWLVISESIDQQPQRKYFVSNAGQDSSLISMLSAGYSRWPIEQDHGQGKNETGMGDYETRTWWGWHHHSALSFLAHHFLVIQRNRLGKKISGDDCGRNTACNSHNMSAYEQLIGSFYAADGVSPAAQQTSTHQSLEEGTWKLHVAGFDQAYSFKTNLRHCAPKLN